VTLPVIEGVLLAMPVSHSIEKFTEEEKKFLLDLAQKAISLHSVPEIKPITARLSEQRGVFVTLNSRGKLRGCIGYILPIRPLYEAVIENALSAAYSDPRFPPLTEKEFSTLTIEISVLSEPEQMKYENTGQLLSKLDSTMGIIIKKGIRTATFLPQVWHDIPGKQEFLTQLCLKAGLQPDAWKHELEIYFYHVQSFEKKW
jgi:AmmeMemoRadiSam system protein A